MLKNGMLFFGKAFLFIWLWMFCHVSVASDAGLEFISGAVTVEDGMAVVDMLEVESDLVIIDVRAEVERLVEGWIPDSVSLPDDQVSPSLLFEVVQAKQTPVLFYCDELQCGASIKAVKIAVDKGYENIYWFRGGMKGWKNLGLAVDHY